MYTKSKLKRGRRPLPIEELPTTKCRAVVLLRELRERIGFDALDKLLEKKSVPHSYETLKSWLLGRRTPSPIAQLAIERALR